MDSADSVSNPIWAALELVVTYPVLSLSAFLLTGPFIAFVALYTLLLFFAPAPRPARKSEKEYITIGANGNVSTPQTLPCWHDNYMALKDMASKHLIPAHQAYQITDAEVYMSLVIPAYNEQDRLAGMLEEAVEYLEAHYGQHGDGGKNSSRKSNSKGGAGAGAGASAQPERGWEIVLVSDGSTDQTVQVALRFAQTHILNASPSPVAGPWNDGRPRPRPTKIPPGSIRVVRLERNRGKGGAVTHGMRHARGRYVVFADADGASRFSDLGKLVAGCEGARDRLGRAVSVGSRAHMVGTEAVVKRSVLRNLLMRGFHLAIWLLTTRRVAKIKDTQCGFKLFTRPSLPYIIPFMHSEGWIFDVEMLMLAESADIPMVEVPIGWKEVMGSKLNVVKDSLNMAVSLLLLRFAWGVGIYRRD